jgi:hypothetical protein
LLWVVATFWLPILNQNHFGWLKISHIMASAMDEEEILRFLDDENEENDESTASCSTNRYKMDKNVLISVSVQDISSFFTKMEKNIQGRKR